MNDLVKFSERNLKALPVTDEIYSVKIAGFPALVCRVRPSKAKTLEIYKKPKGSKSAVRYQLGKVGQDSLADMQQRYHDAMQLYAQGINPNNLKQEQQRPAVKASPNDSGMPTLSEALAEYLRIMRLKPHTMENYRRCIEKDLNDWQSLPIDQISRPMVQERHRQISETVRAGKLQTSKANSVFKVFRAVYNLQLENLLDANETPLLPPCPTSALKRKGVQKRGWNKERRQRGKVAAGQLQEWFAALDDLRANFAGDGPMVADAFEFMLRTGMRLSEVCKLSIHNVNLKARQFVVVDTKNGDPLELPIANQMAEILERRIKDAKRRRESVLFDVAFPRRGYDHMERALGYRRTNKDLRRSFVSIATDHGINAMAVKVLVNHTAERDENTNVTEGYYIPDVDGLRRPMQSINNYIDECVKLGESIYDQ